MFGKKQKNMFKDGKNLELINRKSVNFLRHFTTRFGNIKPRKFTKLSVTHQKKVRVAIIRARELGLLPYIK